MPYKDPYDERGRESRRKHYRANKEIYKARANANRQKVRDYVKQVKEQSPCADCGESYPYYVMQFDHLDSALKTDSVSIMIRNGSMKNVIAEIAKCELVCANCHAKRTFLRAGVAQ